MAAFGISAAILTPFDESGAVDVFRLEAHVKSLLERGLDGVTLFGTTGEGPSVGRDEVIDATAAMVGAGVAAGRITLGLWGLSPEDNLNQIARASALGLSTFLLMPPYYFKDCADDGVFDWHMRLFASAPAGAGFILYHIPQISQAPLSIDLVGRLAAAAPDRVLAVKDSSGDWANTEALLRQNAAMTLVGDERQLHRAAGLGAAGAISGMANLYPERMKRILETGEEDAALSAEVGRVVSRPVIPALKAILAGRSGDDGWRRLRPPLTPLSPKDEAGLAGDG